MDINENSKKDSLKIRIQIMSILALAIAFVYNFSFDLIFTQRSGISEGQPILSGTVLTPILFTFLAVIFSGIFYSVFIVNNKNYFFELANFFFYLFVIYLTYSLFDVIRLATYFTRPLPKIFYVANFISQDIGIYLISLLFIPIYLIFKIVIYIRKEK